MAPVQVSDGTSIEVQDVGSGSPVLLVPGFGMTGTLWRRQVENLSADHRVLAVDPRGHGGSDAPRTGYDLDRLADDLADVLDALGTGAVALVGHSFGGQVGFRLAVRRPDLVALLVLVGSNGVRASRSEEFPYGPPGEKVLAAMIDAERRDRTAARRQGLHCFAGEPPADTLEWLLTESLRMPTWAAEACFTTMFRSDQLADLPALRMPVGQILGAADPVHRVEGARWLAQQFAEPHLVEIADCGHFPMLERPEDFDGALASLLALAPRASRQ